MPLTAKHVLNAKPGRHRDDKGLYLLVSPTGAKSWVLRVVVNDRRRDFGLGSADLVTLSEARDKALSGRRMAKAGVDPSLEWKKAAATVPTFEQAARAFHGIVKDSWRNGKHGDQWLSTMEVHTFPLIGSRRVDLIDVPAIQSVLLPIWLTIPETARRVRQRINAVLDYAHGQGWRAGETPRNAVNSLLKSIKQAKGGNFAAMPYADLPGFMGKLRTGEASIGRLALRFTILTAARSGEVRGAVWDEVDLDAGLWSIPAERMKAGEAHSVPLSPAAVAILREVQGFAFGRPGEPIFPGLRGKPLSDATLAKVLRVAGADAATVHGMRSAFRDWVAEQTSFPGDWAEAALAHTIANKTEASYRRAKYLDQRRKMMDAWADYLAGAANVVRLVASA